MHVVFICASDKKAIARTASVLDAYALRCGDRTWMSPMTTEGLAEVRAELRRLASKNTAVACFRNEGRSSMKLLWTVGRVRVFSENGHYALGETARARTAEGLPPFARAAGVLARLGGFTHDWGKFSRAFQRKLRIRARVADAIRHEWLSAMLLGADEQSWQALWHQGVQQANSGVNDSAVRRVFRQNLNDYLDVLRFIVVTHHRLPNEGPRNADVASGCVNEDAWLRGTERQAFVEYEGEPAPEDFSRLTQLMRRAQAIETPEGCDAVLFWKAVALLSRIALILADHSVSSRRYQGAAREAEPSNVFANTKPGASGRVLDQPLSWHLRKVGFDAGDYVWRYFHYELPSLTPFARERIDRYSENPRFAWQDRVAEKLRQEASIRGVPTLVLNLAATGSGKTRANVRMLSALRPNEGLSFSTALNLRTLTLQTRDSYRDQLGIDADDLACVVGDRHAVFLHDIKDTIHDDDENDLETEFDVVGEDSADVPPWLEAFLVGRPKQRSIVTAPVLVTTIDYLIAAGEPNRQAHHAIAMLRLKSSDLILDEIDSYDPKALVAVCRLVIYAAFWGRNIVASSATLAKPVAQALYRAFEYGSRLRAAAWGQKIDWRLAMVSDSIATEVLSAPTVGDFTVAYEGFVQRMLEPLKGRRMRLAELWMMSRPPFAKPVKTSHPFKKTSAAVPEAKPGATIQKVPDRNDWFASIAAAAEKMHTRHQWGARQSNGRGATLSLGLIRVANIRIAIDLARYLSDRHEGTQDLRVCCYHSQILRIHRWHIERVLDRALKRGPERDDAQIVNDPEIQKLFAQAGSDNLCLIVVATPVEEVGRDHDFDWAVIEPSSTQSIVQCAGRVNRHRQVAVTEPNITVLQFNHRAWVAKSESEVVFHWPGLEAAEWRYASHDMARMITWDAVEQIDARLRFGAHELATSDDKALITATIGWLNRVTDGANAHLWMSEDTYLRTPLRDQVQRMLSWCVIPDEHGNAEYKVLTPKDSGEKWVTRKAEIRIAPKRSWLSPSFHELLDMCDEVGLSYEDGMQVNVRPLQSEQNGSIVDYSGYGFYGAG